MCVAAVLFDRPDFKRCAGKYSESAFWLLGPEGHQRYERIDSGADRTKIRSRRFPDSGLYLLQCGHRGEQDRISVTFDCGELGFKSIAAHGHADALSFTLRAFGTDIIVDPGTYDYFTYPAWRDYFRSTRAHNTIVIDGRDQSEMLGLFLWGRRAEARCLQWEASGDEAVIVGEHDGYCCLSDPVSHRRTIRLDGRNRVVFINDELLAHERHEVVLYFHLAEDCRAVRSGENLLRIECASGTADLEFDPRLTVSAVTGSEDPMLGWVSRGYHHKVPATTVFGRCVTKGPMSLTTRISLSLPQ
jgi:hypothetical protein